MNIVERFWSKVDKTPGYGPDGTCWEWTAYRTKEGYGMFGIGSATIKSHRFAYECEHGVLPSWRVSRIVVRHSCDNPPCCNPAHLKIGTQADNVQDRDQRKRGRWSSGTQNGSYTKPERRRRGVNHGRAELTEEDVLSMRTEYASGGASHSRLATKFDISETQVGRILRREQWTHI